MKKLRSHILLSVALLIFSIASWAQVSSFEDFYSKYAKTQGMEVKSVGKMTLMAARAVGQGDKIPNGMEGMKAVSLSEPSKAPAGTASAMWKDIGSVIAAKGYVLLSEKSQDKVTIKSYILNVPGKTTVKNPIIWWTSTDGKTGAAMLIGEFLRTEKFMQQLIK